MFDSAGRWLQQVSKDSLDEGQAVPESFWRRGTRHRSGRAVARE
jgi:hypothetical protein